MRNSFIFYRSFYEAITELEPNDKLAVYDAISKYSLNDENAELTGIPKAIWTLIKPLLEANKTRYDNGKKGGRPKTKTKPKHNRSVTEAKGNKDKDKDKDKDNNINTYLSLFNSLFNSKYKPTKGRSDKLKLRLRVFSLEQILKSLENLSTSDFHQGKNDRGWKADPDFLLRSDEQIDKWINVETKKQAKPKIFV